ncbi:CPBP family intramembrane metalloprotease [Bifidobacterium sp. ESL0682]|uniref:CPBP family intramembrane glutamic endopeptidase n=1 Tax=Bifidobacterium sp. ESL0682 TaxID=2983212 RepID=UPI0023F97A65|nr:CPBP family intramembrane glutamic endopeptidase [Bifidobacterium sp. ESL0682]WEV41335.1 CPBP family intramembrane metalloprotease [Bifidobacterium sp. ESL0682]
MLFEMVPYYEDMKMNKWARTADLLTIDHPDRMYERGKETKEPRRLNVLLRGLVFLGVFMAVLVLASMLLRLVCIARYGSMAKAGVGDMHSPVMFFEMLAEVVAAVAGYVVVVHFMERRHRPVELRASRWTGLLAGAAIGFAAVGVCVGVLAIAGDYRVTGFDTGYNPWIDLFASGICAGIAEEIIMRGMLLRLVEEWLGSWGAVAVSALAFGLMHLGNQDGSLWGGLAIAIEDGILAAALYFVTRSLWVCIGEHAMWNIAEGPIFGSVISGNGRQGSWLIPRWSGPDLMTGGQFGLEASIIPVVIMGAVGIALLVYAQRKGLLVKPSWTRRRLLSDKSL